MPIPIASLFEPADFSTASFLLSVLGEGTFLDLLAFLEAHAPDPATREICRRSRVDEARHVRFGIAHARVAGIPQDRIVNYWPEKKFLEWARGAWDRS